MKNLKEIIFIILILIISFSTYSQSIKLTTKGSHHAIINGDTISNNNQYKEAIEAGLNALINDPFAQVSVVFPSRVDLSFEGIGDLWKTEVDTFHTLGDYILLDYTNSLMNPTIKAKKYALITNVGLVEIEADTIYRFQTIFKLERRRITDPIDPEFGDHYKSIGLPFQFRDSLYLEPRTTSYRLQTFATKQHCVSYYLDNKEYAINKSCVGGALSDIEFRHTMVYENLLPDTEYLVRVEGNVLETGEIDFKEFKIKTLKE